MKNKLSDLNNYLFEQIENLSDNDFSDEHADLIIKKAEAVNTIAETIIKNGELQLKAMKIASEYGVINQDQVKFLLSPVKEDKDV